MDHRARYAGGSAEKPNYGDVWLLRLPVLEDQDTSVPGDAPSPNLYPLKQFSREDLNEILKRSSQFIILSFNKYENEIHNSSQMEGDGKSLQGMINEPYL